MGVLGGHRNTLFKWEEAFDPSTILARGSAFQAALISYMIDIEAER